MAYIQTTKRLIHVKEGLTKLKNRLFQSHYSEQQKLQNIDFITVTEIMPEIDIYFEERKFNWMFSDSRTAEELESMWNERKEQYIKQNEKLSKGKKILVRVNDIMELHDER